MHFRTYLVPGHVGGSLDHVVAVPARDRDEGDSSRIVPDLTKCQQVKIYKNVSFNELHKIHKFSNTRQAVIRLRVIYHQKRLARF